MSGDQKYGMAEFRALLESKLAEAQKANVNDAPVPLIGVEAKAWHDTRASLLNWVIEMLPAEQTLGDKLMEALSPGIAAAMDEADTLILTLRQALLDIQKRSTATDMKQISSTAISRLPEAYRVPS